MRGRVLRAQGRVRRAGISAPGFPRRGFRAGVSAPGFPRRGFPGVTCGTVP